MSGGTRWRLAILPAMALVSCRQDAGVMATDAWARDSLGRTANAAVFMTLASSRGDKLIAASTPAAARTDLMTFEGGSAKMAMRYVKAVPLPPGKTVRLDPSGFHVWLEGLRQPLRAGQTFPLTLTFEDAGEQRISVTVIAPAAAPPRSDG